MDSQEVKMNGSSSVPEEEFNSQDEISQLRKKLANCEDKNQIHLKEINHLKKQLSEYRNKFSAQETENESFGRIVEFCNSENDPLPQKSDSASSSDEDVDILKAEIRSLQEQNRNLRNSLDEMNVARDEVVEKLKDVSIETRELIENCEKASEETKIFKTKSHLLEDELKNANSRNETLQRENERLRREIESKLTEMKTREDVNANNAAWIPVVENANKNLNNISSHVIDVLEELQKNNRIRVELQNELTTLKKRNLDLWDEIKEKNAIISKQSEDVVQIKKTVDEYHAEIVKLDTELKDCRSRVSVLNENLEAINAENLDLAEFTNFKSWVKKLGKKENVDKLLSKLQTLHEIEELFDKKLAPHVNQFHREQKDVKNSTDNDKNVNAINKIKSYLERALYAIEKLNEKNLRLAADYENDIQTRDDEISRLKEILSHTSLYNEILEQTLKQCRENAKIDKFIEEKTDELITANKALLDNFEELREVYRFSHRYNDLLFVKYRQLNVCYKILKINALKMITADTDGNVHAANNLRNLFYLMDELFREIVDKKTDFDRHAQDTRRIFSTYEVSLATKDYLKNTVNDMTLEVKRLTSKVEREMAEKIREIESLRLEVDSVKTDNRELVTKIKNCNREIISLSTENYDLNEKLTMLSEAKNKADRCENSSENPTASKTLPAEKLAQVRRQCLDLKEENETLRLEIISLKDTNDAAMRHLVEYLRSSVPELNKAKDANLISLRDTCAELRRENQLLKETANSVREQMFREIRSLKSHLDDSNIRITNPSEVDCKSGLNDLHAKCVDLKRQNEDMKQMDILKSLNETLESANSTLSTKMQNISVDFERMQHDLEVALANKKQRENIITSHFASTTKIADDLKTLRQLLATFVKEIPAEFSKCSASLLRNIQEATAHTFNHMKASIAQSNEEVLKEMQEMNLELKKRGETISSLNQNVDELVREKQNITQLFTENEALVNKLKEEASERIAAIVEKDLRIEAFNRELADLKTQLGEKNADLSNALTALEKTSIELRSKEETIATLENEISKNREIQDGDVSSMGNISRTEEVSRLRDVEDSFEERYLKLRSIAIKMKKTIAELNQQLKSEKTERSNIQSKLNAAIEQAKRNQALQEECDRVTDELEMKNKEIKELKKIIAETDRLNDDLKRQCQNLTDKMEFVSKRDETFEAEKKEVETQVKSLALQLQNVEKEKFVQETLKKEYEKEIHQLKQKIKEGEDSIKKIQNNLEQAKLEARKQGALTLEMRDYEKTISDLAEKLEKKQLSVDELTEKLKISTESNVSLVERIKQLEEQITSFGASNKIADEQILYLNKIISSHEKNLEVKEASLKNLMHQLEEEKCKSEKLTLQLADCVTELNSLKELNKTKEEFLNSQLKSSQNKVTTLDEKLKKKENEFDKLKEDFESYKIRAHNVIQKLKSQSNYKDNEEKLKVEIENLSHTVKELRSRLDETLNDLDKQKTEIKLVETAKEKLQLRIKELNEAYTKKTNELSTTNAEFKSYKLNSETLIKCYKDEIENLQTVCEKLKADLQEIKMTKECEQAFLQNDNAAVQVEEKKENVPNASKMETQDYQLFKNDTKTEIKSKIEKDSAGREKNRNHALIPLDKLLQADEPEEKRGDVNELKKNIKLLENQVTYLSGILNESEKNAARNEQQVALLKYEIRRLQKTIERAPHLQNGEYLKNVLFNFFTFPDGEEKCRLITILETLLQLTSEETETLSAIAKGYRVEQKRTSSSGITSMLRLW